MSQNRHDASKYSSVCIFESATTRTDSQMKLSRSKLSLNHQNEHINYEHKTAQDTLHQNIISGFILTSVYKNEPWTDLRLTSNFVFCQKYPSNRTKRSEKILKISFTSVFWKIRNSNCCCLVYTEKYNKQQFITFIVEFVNPLSNNDQLRKWHRGNHYYTPEHNPNVIV